MRFSLVVATLGRTVELERLLKSLETQTYKDFEVILVDQNGDDRLVPIVQPFAEFMTIKRLTAAPGVSRARNLGLGQAIGEVIAFPDDDCWYASEVLEMVDGLLQKNPRWQGLLGDSVDPSGKKILPWKDQAGTLTPAMSWRHSSCISFFFRAEVLRRVGGFDEMLGPGSGTPWGCGEDNDLMLRILAAGNLITYVPELRITHPKMFLSFDAESRVKRSRYAYGDGWVLRKHPMPAWWKALFYLVPVARMALALVKCDLDQARFHWGTFLGRYHGAKGVSGPNNNN